MVRGLIGFVKDYLKLKIKILNNDFPIKFYPILKDKYRPSGTAKGHYFHPYLLVAQKVYAANPSKHIDIGSKVDSFVAHLLTFRKVIIVDIRPLKSEIENIEFLQANMIEIQDDLYESCESLSSLLALEHFGLGRYGDPVDPDGHLKGFRNMYNMLKDKGVLYFSVPMGRQRIEFNAHRVFSVLYLMAMIKGKFSILGFSFVDDDGSMHKEIEIKVSL